MTQDQIAATARLFSSTVLRDLARRGRSSLFARLAGQSGLATQIPPSDPVRSLYDRAFTHLKKQGHRHEYIYKSALTHKILLGTHSLRTASMLNEFRVGDCIADLAILNGTASVYEIKSERDSLTRLQRQVETYSLVFASVNIIVAESHLDTAAELVPDHVGLLCLNSRYQISSIRDALDQPERTSPGAIFDAVRLKEAQMILKATGAVIPKVPNTLQHRTLRELFVNLTPDAAHRGMVCTLKKTRNLLPLSDLVEAVPLSLQTAALSLSLRKADHNRLMKAVDTKLADALNWA